MGTLRMNKNNCTANLSDNQCEITCMGDNFYQDDFTFFLVVQVLSHHYLRKKYSKLC